MLLVLSGPATSFGLGLGLLQHMTMSTMYDNHHHNMYNNDMYNPMSHAHGVVFNFQPRHIILSRTTCPGLFVCFFFLFIYSSTDNDNAQ